MKKYLSSVNLILLSVSCFAQQNVINSIDSYGIGYPPSVPVIGSYEIADNSKFANIKFDKSFINDDIVFAIPLSNNHVNFRNATKDKKMFFGQPITSILKTNNEDFLLENLFIENNYNSGFEIPKTIYNSTSVDKDNFFDKNRRNIYSSLWAFATLNYLYADVIGFMDKDVHSQFHTGAVDGLKITPQFLALGAAFMQIPISNVFLPQIIKNEKILRWVQIASGTIMTLVQASTLLIGKPTPYYVLFSAFEIGATTFITIDALKWKTNSSKKIPIEGN